MELREPKKKRVGPHIKPQQPLPILIESESGIPAASGLWPLYVGNFTGDCVVLCNPEEMISLYTMGYFGKGSFSRGYPSFGLTKKGIPPVIKERQWLRRKSWMDKMKDNFTNLRNKNVIDSLKETSSDNDQGKVEQEMPINKEISTTQMDVDGDDNQCSDTCGNGNDQDLNTKLDSTCNNVRVSDVEQNMLKHTKNEDCEIRHLNFSDKVLVIADSDEEDIEKVIREPQPHLEDESIKTAVETLNLTLEEAFFLSFGLGCLQVIDISGESMTLNNLWQTFCGVKPDFIELYVAYHYFRAKGWVVKSGYKFGGEFLLYKQGPPFYHASYVVLVERVNSRLHRHRDSLTWTKLHGLHRLAENSGKDIITCQVIFPDNMTPEDLMTPKSLPRFQVKEIMTKRWISSQERAEKDQS